MLLPEILPRLHFGLFHRDSFGLSRLSIPRMQIHFALFSSRGLVGYLLCFKSDQQDIKQDICISVLVLVSVIVMRVNAVGPLTFCDFVRSVGTNTM